MSLWFDVARIAAALNVVLLLLLVYVWGRNYVDMRSKHTLGLLFFAVFLLFENLLALYYYLADPTLSAWFSSSVPDIAWQAMMALHVFELVGLAFITWTTWD